MKTLFFAFLFLPFLSFCQSTDTNYVDTSFTFVHLAKCGDQTNSFTPSPKVQLYLRRFEKATNIVECVHAGEAFVDGTYYKCITIYKIVIKVNGKFLELFQQRKKTWKTFKCYMRPEAKACKIMWESLKYFDKTLWTKKS